MEQYKKVMEEHSHKFKISAPTWNEEFELPDGSYSISDFQVYFEYMLKKHGEKTFNPSIRKYINKIENKITFKIKTGYYLELLTPETMKSFGSTKNKIKKDKNGENVPYLEIAEVVLIHSLREKCLNTEFFLLHIQAKYRKIRTRKKYVLGHSSRSDCNVINNSY